MVLLILMVILIILQEEDDTGWNYAAVFNFADSFEVACSNSGEDPNTYTNAAAKKAVGVAGKVVVTFSVAPGNYCMWADDALGCQILVQVENVKLHLMLQN